jgi:hypothetical protein
MPTPKESLGILVINITLAFAQIIVCMVESLLALEPEAARVGPNTHCANAGPCGPKDAAGDMLIEKLNLTCQRAICNEATPARISKVVSSLNFIPLRRRHEEGATANLALEELRGMGINFADDVKVWYV